ncbi:FAD-dependent oxidoreductase [Zobellia galactanivorans]|uniref:NAD(P)/FAD-dependent oxidoreductase n=1 Tax=Zobellia galactanivorans (strain DSM 12802 / CCUG 47099 / CIP 106680 / NCIMB 13871 / Dsij) TaxID=63186 RepID=UPI0026E24FEA|nr:FAD-dependent oxidoreductase [Zobellia galactanivorans]MDO6808125.1 FAD-dependent oxidoreductase [Zobellia galactanivorans]
MSDIPNNEPSCVVIGASHAGVNFAFALRREGWNGSICLIDADSVLPYHRPPLSKAYLISDDGIEKNLLKSKESYVKERIELKLGVWVDAINRESKTIILADGTTVAYDKLVLATGARPIMPPIPGLDTAKNLFPLRSAADVANIKKTVAENESLQVVVIGGGYIGLETAASLKKLGASVTVLERESRILARVTAPEMSAFFQKLHRDNHVSVLTEKNVTSIEPTSNGNTVVCSDGSSYPADMVIVGVGIHVNKELAEKAGLTIENGIRVNEMAQTSDASIYAIGDCTFHYNPHYDRYIRLESVQNAVDQAKIAAAAIAGKKCCYDTLPWFWSDQYDVKLQMVGLSDGYDEVVVREEADKPNCFSVWYFKGDTLLSVDVVNNAKAYVYGTKFIKGGEKIDKSKLGDPTADFKPANLVAQ